MSTVRLTEERLRTWTLAQADRERMCVGILGGDPRFTDVKPRRPKGGPDGSRDIVALYNGREVWGAVGFRNSVSDSPQDKRWAKQKFRNDLKLAKRENSELVGFIFFTNVDLTPGELEKMKGHANKLGIPFVDIYNRERLRIALDSPTGLSLRYQYLQVPLSEAEQASFFAEWGSQMEEALHKGFGGILHEIERLRRLLVLVLRILELAGLIKLSWPSPDEPLGIIHEVKAEAGIRIIAEAIAKVVHSAEAEHKE